MKKISRNQLFIAYIVTLFFLMLFPFNDIAMINKLEFEFQADLFVHGFLLIPWMFFLPNTKKYLWALAGVVFGVCLETTHYFLPYRTFNVNDIVANIIGLILGCIAFFIWNKMKKKS